MKEPRGRFLGLDAGSDRKPGPRMRTALGLITTGTVTVSGYVILSEKASCDSVPGEGCEGLWWGLLVWVVPIAGVLFLGLVVLAIWRNVR